MTKHPAPIYLDYMASTPCDESIIEEMAHWHRVGFSNPHSVDHFGGREAEAAIEQARGDVAAHIGATSQEIIFTSGATEANNLSIKGSFGFLARYDAGYSDYKPRIVLSAGEHKCVLEAAARAEEDYGAELCHVPLTTTGQVDLEAFEMLITVQNNTRTRLVSVMAVNNETGVINPIADIAKICRHAEACNGGSRILLHCDAAQALGKIPVNVREWDVDLLSISGHKVYGPKGVGALYVRRRPRTRLRLEMNGGGQERGLRSGTNPTPLIVGLGRAVALAGARLEADQAQARAHRALFFEVLENAGVTVGVNGPTSPDAHIPSGFNIYFTGTNAAKLLKEVPHIWVSRGSACSTTDLAPSHVLKAMKLSDQRAHESFRVCFGRLTTQNDVRRAAQDLAGVVLAYALHDTR